MRTGACVAGSALVLTPVALTGCGSSGARSVELVTRAAAKTSNQPSEHMTIYATITTRGSVSTVRGSGDFRNRPLLGRLEMDAGSVGAGDISMGEIVSGSMAYLSSDGFFGEIPPGKQWLAVGAAGAGISTAAATSLSPLQALAQLKAAGDAKKVGDETVDGVQTTHYAVTVDPARIPADVVRAFHPRYRSVDVWIDRQGRVRQEVLAVSGRAGRTPVSASMKIDLGRFGEAVSVKAPTRDETFRVSQVKLNAILNGGP